MHTLTLPLVLLLPTALVAVAPMLPGQGIDLATRYPATLDHQEGAGPCDWTSGPGDVFALRSFSWRLGDQLRIELDASQVVFGVHGTNVVWAVVLPDKPGTLDSKVGGDGERVESLWLRFHPALTGELFPKSTVAIAALVAELEDLHAWVVVGSESVPGYTRPRPLNGNFKACGAILGGLQDTKHDMLWGRTKDGIGYVNIHQLNDQQSPKVLDDVLEQLGDTWGLVVDLRFNGGGDELLARQLAGRFLDHPRVYSYNHYRSGPRHDQLGPKLARECAPRGPWRYQSPVVVLQGQRTMFSAESFLLMLAECPQVTTIGDRSAGSSGNPRRVELEGEIRVNLPRWIDLDAEGRPIETIGVAPDVSVPAEVSQFTDIADPVLEAALEHLRGQPEDRRRPGKR